MYVNKLGRDRFVAKEGGGQLGQFAPGPGLSGARSPPLDLGHAFTI